MDRLEEGAEALARSSKLLPSVVVVSTDADPWTINGYLRTP